MGNSGRKDGRGPLLFYRKKQKYFNMTCVLGFRERIQVRKVPQCPVADERRRALGVALKAPFCLH